MPFENFYDDAKNHDLCRKEWVIAILAAAFLIVPLFCLFAYVSVDPQYMISSVNESFVTTRPAGKVAEETCLSLPKPEKFVYVSRETVPESNGAATTVMRYQSSRGLEEIMPTFQIWFDDNYWKADANLNLTFRRGDQTIAIRRDDRFAVNYEILCSAREEKISFGIYD